MLVMQRLEAYIVPAIQHISWMLTAAPWPGGAHFQTFSALPLRTTSARVFPSQATQFAMRDLSAPNS
jgi:hypothetical protein